MSRIKDWESRFHAKVLSSDRGYIPSSDGWPSRGETSLQVVVEGAISGNSIQPQGRLKDQASWVDIGSAISGASTGTTVDVSKFDEHRLKVVTWMGTGSVNEQQTITPSAAPSSGSYKLNFGGSATALIAHNATADQIRDAIRAALPGLDLVTVSGTLATVVTVVFVGYKGNAALMTVTDNTLSNGGAVTLTVAQSVAGVAGADNTVIASGFHV